MHGGWRRVRLSRAVERMLLRRRRHDGRDVPQPLGARPELLHRYASPCLQAIIRLGRSRACPHPGVWRPGKSHRFNYFLHTASGSPPLYLSIPATPVDGSWSGTPARLCLGTDANGKPSATSRACLAAEGTWLADDTNAVIKVRACVRAFACAVAVSMRTRPLTCVRRRGARRPHKQCRPHRVASLRRGRSRPVQAPAASV